MKYAIAIDFGSTFTKLVIIDMEEKRVIHSDKVPSTVGSDAAVGMNQCFDIAKEKIGKEKDTVVEYFLASSCYCFIDSYYFYCRLLYI